MPRGGIVRVSSLEAPLLGGVEWPLGWSCEDDIVLSEEMLRISDSQVLTNGKYINTSERTDRGLD